MGNMSSQISNKEAYNLLSIEQQCVRNRFVCNKDCINCHYHQDTVRLDAALSFVLDVLKQRDPELHLLNDIDKLSLILSKKKGNKDV